MAVQYGNAHQPAKGRPWAVTAHRSHSLAHHRGRPPPQGKSLRVVLFGPMSGSSKLRAMSGLLTLAQIAARQPVLEVRCTKCDRRGRYRTATVVERYGAGFAGPDLRDMLSAFASMRLAMKATVSQRTKASCRWCATLNGPASPPCRALPTP